MASSPSDETEEGTSWRDDTATGRIHMLQRGSMAASYERRRLSVPPLRHMPGHDPIARLDEAEDMKPQPRLWNAAVGAVAGPTSGTKTASNARAVADHATRGMGRTASATAT